MSEPDETVAPPTGSSADSELPEATRAAWSAATRGIYFASASPPRLFQPLAEPDDVAAFVHCVLRPWYAQARAGTEVAWWRDLPEVATEWAAMRGGVVTLETMDPSPPLHPGVMTFEPAQGLRGADVQLPPMSRDQQTLEESIRRSVEVEVTRWGPDVKAIAQLIRDDVPKSEWRARLGLGPSRIHHAERKLRRQVLRVVAKARGGARPGPARVDAAIFRRDWRGEPPRVCRDRVIEQIRRSAIIEPVAPFHRRLAWPVAVSALAAAVAAMAAL